MELKPFKMKVAFYDYGDLFYKTIIIDQLDYEEYLEAIKKTEEEYLDLKEYESIQEQLEYDNGFEDFIRDKYEEEAIEEYRNGECDDEDDKDPYHYFGVSRKDFF